jgi:hypothetical protein
MALKEAAMGKIIWVALLVGMWVGGWAGSLHIEPAEVSLGGSFLVVVAGVEAEAGEVLVVNVRTGEQVRLPLHPEEGQLVTGHVYVVRECDPVPPEAEYLLRVLPGDVIAAATELEEGLAATALVLPPTGAPELSLATWDEGRAAWCPREAGAQLPAGRFKITVTDPNRDLACEPETALVLLRLGERETRVDLRETGPASGQFTGEFVLEIAPQESTLQAKVLHEGTELFSTTLEKGLALEVSYQEITYTFPLLSVQISLELTPGAREDVGCPVRLAVISPEAVDQVQWFVDGLRQPEGGAELLLVRSEPTYPEPVTVVALVQAAGQWGQTEAAITLVPRTEIAFVDSETGQEVAAPCECTTSLRVKLTQALDDEHPRVWIGILGPGCTARELALIREGEGVYLSEPFVPQDLGACLGDVLWAQYKDPSCWEDVAYVLLPLR